MTTTIVTTDLLEQTMLNLNEEPCVPPSEEPAEKCLSQESKENDQFNDKLECML